ncbi:unnamed protein product [Owenia fusiformis]|uniref:Uncharacterized protein n=1 Tax=Owenia fusiformis TaxID=6347 RepID=A0A8J1U5Z8_OWEFU|nr:unnamed protein product [Owenia fusiformis]
MTMTESALAMDPQTLMIAAAIIIGAFILVYLISVFGIRERSYEEALEAQKQRQEDDKQTSKKSKKDQRAKKGFRRNKGDKEASRASPESEEEIPHKMVELEIEPEIIEPSETTPRKRKNKAKPEKSILLNKDEVSYRQDESKVHEAFHPKSLPRDEIEQKHAHEQVTVVETTQTKSQKRTVKTEVITEEKVKVVESEPVKSAPVPKKEKKERKSDNKETFQLATTVRQATLSSTEMQTLIDILLNKQGGATPGDTWSTNSKKGDPITQMKKQLEEKEEALKEEQQRSQSANSKLYEIRQEQAQERSRYSVNEKKLQETIQVKDSEIQALHTRMQQTHGQHVAEMNAMQQNSQYGEGHAQLIQRLQEENKQLKEVASRKQSSEISPAQFAGMKNQLEIIKTELNSNVIKLNTSENAKRNLEQKVAGYENQLRQIDSSKRDTTMLSKKLDEVSEQLRHAEMKNISIAKDADQAAKVAEDEISNLKDRLRSLEANSKNKEDNTKALELRYKDIERQKIDLESKVKSTETQLSNVERQKAEINLDLMALKQENKALKDELHTTQERQQGEGAEEPSVKGVTVNGDTAKPTNTVDIHTHEKLLQDKDKELGRLCEDLEAQKQKNNDLRSKVADGGSATEEVSKLQNDLESKQAAIDKLESIVETQKRHNDELQEKYNSLQTQESVTSGDSQEVSKLQEELAAQRKKNDELREKNWKAMEAVAAAEKVAEEKVQVAVKQSKADSVEQIASQEVSAQETLLKIFPQIKITETIKTHEEWMKVFEKEITHYVTKTSVVKDPALEKELSAAKENEEKLQSQVENYKSVLANTESILNKLQTSVEQEEAKWQERLQLSQSQQQETETEVKQLREQLKNSNTEMEQKIERLQGELQQSEKHELQSSQSIDTVDARPVDNSDLLKLIEQLKGELAEERKTSKELGTQNVRLNSTVKIGQDSLKAEQDLVKNLQNELSQKTKDYSTLANLTHCDWEIIDTVDKAGSGSSDVDQLRSKLAEKERQLEKEIMANRQLSQRLTAFGIHVNEIKSASPQGNQGNGDIGTAV